MLYTLMLFTQPTCNIIQLAFWLQFCHDFFFQFYFCICKLFQCFLYIIPLVYWPILYSGLIIIKISNIKKHMKSIKNILSVLDLAAIQLYRVLLEARPNVIGSSSSRTNAKRKEIQPTCNNLDFLYLFPWYIGNFQVIFFIQVKQKFR